MIEQGTKYGSARGQKKAVETRGVAAAGTAALRGGARASGPRIFVPSVTGRRMCLQEWYWRELKEGGFLHSYLERERRVKNAKDLRKVARMMDGFTQNNKSDLRLLAKVPARLYQRWKAEDRDFFSDDKNLRSLRRDNPDACVYL